MARGRGVDGVVGVGDGERVGRGGLRGGDGEGVVGRGRRRERSRAEARIWRSRGVGGGEGGWVDGAGVVLAGVALVGVAGGGERGEEGDGSDGAARGHGAHVISGAGLRIPLPGVVPVPVQAAGGGGAWRGRDVTWS